MRLQLRDATIFELIDMQIEAQDPLQPIETIYLNESEYDYFARSCSGYKSGFQYGNDNWQYTYREIPVKKDCA